jgi:hypothetical protein
MYAALIRASPSWRRILIQEFEQKQIEELRQELTEAFLTRHGSLVQLL